jgi:Rhs element Vgr protein
MPEVPGKNDEGLVTLTIYSDGDQLPGEVGIVSVEIVKSLGKIPVARIEVDDGDMPNADFPVSNGESFKPGAEIRIDAGYDSDKKTVFKGVVVRHAVKIGTDNYSRLMVECRDKAIAMTIGRSNANYVDSTDSDIISKLIGAHGLTASVSSTSTSNKEIVQYYCSDWDFLVSRAEINGFLVSVEEGTVTVAAPQTDAQPALTVKYGESIISFQGELDAVSQLPPVTAASWDPKSQQTVEAEVGAQSLNRQGNLGASELAQVVGPKGYRLQSVAPMEQEVLKSWAKGCQVKAGLARIRGRLKFPGSALAKPGGLIELAGVGERFNGNVFVTSVRHEFRSGQWTSEAEFGLAPEWFAERRDLTAPPASGILPGVEGLQIGVVKKLDQDPEGQHKVQVSVPLMKAETDGVWARLSGYYASNGFGAFFVPEVGDEVVLGYFNNDPSHPVILGSLYSSKLNPPYTLTAENNTKALVTRSKLKLEFDEEKKVVTIVTPGKNKIVISDDDKSILLQDQNDNKVKLSPDGLLLESPKDISISAKGKISLDAIGAVSVSSKSDVKVEGLNVSHTAQIGFVGKGSATAELSASGQTTVKGALVMIN